MERSKWWWARLVMAVVIVFSLLRAVLALSVIAGVASFAGVMRRVSCLSVPVDDVEVGHEYDGFAVFIDAEVGRVYAIAQA